MKQLLLKITFYSFKAICTIVELSNNLPAGNVELEKAYKNDIKKEAWSSLGKKKMVSIRSGLEHFPCKIREKKNWEGYDTYRRKKNHLEMGI